MKSTSEQNKIISHKTGHAMVQAGAGSGKTTTLIARIKNTIDIRRVLPDSILALTFSNSVRQEIISRWNNNGYEPIPIHTFHSFGFELIRENFSLLGFSRPPEHGRVTNKRKNRVSFKDMLNLSLQLAKAHPDAFQRSIAKYQYLYIDELQDINKQHMQLILHLAKTINNVMLFGDKKQAINGYLGANIQYWQTLEKELKPKIYQLTVTFRIKSASLSFINRVGAAIDDDLPLTSFHQDEGRKIARKRGVADKNEQAKLIVGQIKRLIDEGVEPNQIVCLGRTKKQLAQLYNALCAHGLEADRMYIERTTNIHLRMMRRLLRLTLWYQAHRRQRKPTLYDEFQNTTRKLLSLLKATAEEKNSIIETVQQQGLNGFHITNKVNERLYRDLLAFRQAIVNAAGSEYPERSIQPLIDFLSPILKRRYKRDWKSFMQQDLSDLKVNSRNYAGLSTTNIRKLTDLPPIQTGNRVQLATCNYAKGKEWKHVFVIHVVQGVFPHYMAQRDEEKQLEELRLFYVAITRHRERLYLMECPIIESRYSNRSGSRFRHHLDGQSEFFDI